MNGSGWNMYVFRDGRYTISGSDLLSSLRDALGRWRCAHEHDEDLALAALVAAGELECALDDSVGGSSRVEDCRKAATITDAIASGFLSGQRHSLSTISQASEELRAEGTYEIAVQEGFAYYALHPRKVRMLVDKFDFSGPTAVIGIRSIGVTLSAVTCAALRLRGLECDRICVRPAGHPYDRKLELSDELREWFTNPRWSEFLIVDEGPGISGSSFLAVAEALVNCGVDPNRIHLLGSRSIDPASLRATNAGERWRRFQFHVMQNAPLPPAEAGESLSGGTWRQRFAVEGEMPASWPALEPAKFLSRDGRSVFRFEGFGHYGSDIGARAQALAKLGFSPQYLGNHVGFGRYQLVPGRMLTRGDWSSELRERVAEYLALRSATPEHRRDKSDDLETMLRWNWQLEFGSELDADESRLIAKRIVTCDGRMMPHEWLRTEDGRVLKLDAVTHGDNHFFPGPCDIAWDVAGVIVEWELSREERDRFVRAYEARSGDRVSDRLASYLLAYATFWMGWSKMAALAMKGEFDEALLTRNYQRYRTHALQLRSSSLSAPVFKLEGATEKLNPSLGSMKIA